MTALRAEMKARVRVVQRELHARHLYASTIDGILGSKTEKALDAITAIPLTWPKSRKITAFIQMMCNESSIEAGPMDGYWGPQTAFAFDSLQYLLQYNTLPPLWRDEKPSLNPNHWPVENELQQFYGERGENQSRIQLPYPHRLAWDKRKVVHSCLCHEKVHDSLERVLRSVLDHYGLEEIKQLRLDLWGGCLNVRKMRGGSRWSTHSWGVAMDYDPSNNSYKWGRDRAAFAAPVYDPWWQCWEAEGWQSLGRRKNYDWMHIQAVR
ncbi:MAG: hypothetical protein Q9M31_09010 [Mariprofundus sp.]|nr:hypothetical protein [Mariprofundus sp.]